MKQKIWLILLILFMTSIMTANMPFEISIEGRTFYNILRISSLDIRQPQNQPRFFTITVRNIGAPVDRPDLHFKLFWENEELINSKVTYQGTVGAVALSLTNRHIFVESGHYQDHSFSNPTPPISISDVIDRIPYVRETVLRTGLFPDGRYILTAQFKRNNSDAALSQEVRFVFIVRNPSGIFLISPGSEIGGIVPGVSLMPVNFIWSSGMPGHQNPYTLTVKEFEDASQLAPGLVEVSGQVIHTADNLNNTFYSEFLPLREGRYYAWQVKTNIISTDMVTSEVSSNFNVFRYTSDGDDIHSQNVKFLNFFLLNLNIPEIMDLLSAGYIPSGIVDQNGRILTEAEIEAAIQEIMNRNINRVTVLE